MNAVIRLHRGLILWLLCPLFALSAVTPTIALAAAAAARGLDATAGMEQRGRRGGHGGGHHGGHRHARPRPHHHHHHMHRGWHPGPRWHPVGFFLTTMAVTAVVVHVASSNEKVYYDDGTYYKETTSDQGEKGYTVVQAPIGARVPTLPEGSAEVDVAGKNYYYHAGVFYFPDTDGEHYVVVQPPTGAVIPYLPDGYKKEYHGDILYYVYGDIYYQPKSVNGEVSYEVVGHP